VSRIAHRFNRLLRGRKFKASSPNGRFRDEAHVIDGKKFAKMEAIGKNLFAFFEADKHSGSHHVIHIHFGMSGRFMLTSKDAAAEPTGTTRLRLEDEKYVALLSAMTVKLGSDELFAEKKRVLGQDPLREDADPEILWKKIQKSNKIIGRLLMDQSFFAGVGNIFRAEILFKAGVHPNIPASMISRESFDRIWFHTVELLQRGFQTGSILTVDKEEAEKLGKPKIRRYIYNQAKCGRCDGPVKSWDMASRTCYACLACQPRMTGMSDGDEEDAQVETGKVFLSHCARDSLEDRLKTPEKLTLQELKRELQANDLSTSGRKAELLQRYVEHVELQATCSSSSSSIKKLRVSELKVKLKEAGLKTSGKKAVLVKRLEEAMEMNDVKDITLVVEKKEKLPKPGTKHIQAIASATYAAREKKRAGEKRNVEHVAELEDLEPRRKKSKPRTRST